MHASHTNISFETSVMTSSKTSNSIFRESMSTSQRAQPLISPFNPPSTPPFPNLYPKLTATAQNNPKQSNVGPQRSWYVTALLSLILFTLHKYKPAL